MDSLILDVVAVNSLVEENLYMEDTEEDSLEAAGLAQILEHEKYSALPNDDRCQTEAC